MDFLTKKKKANDGEIPQYYVKGNHEAIIEPDVFDMVQREMQRRKPGRNRHSGVRVFSGKIHCRECGGLYGSKVWHSNDPYRRVIWQCKYDDLSHPVNKNSLLGIISGRMYMQAPCFNRVMEIDSILKKALPDIFQRERPKNENDFNDKLHGILNLHDEFTREYPVLSFGLSSYRADQAKGDLIIESKYIREKVSPSVADEGIAADIVKIPADYGIMFVVYDPEGSIKDPIEFSRAFEAIRKDCYVRIYR